MLKYMTLLLAALALASCGSGRENDPVYLALKANPPTSIPERDLAKLRAGKAACNLYEEGTANEYQTCWFPSGKPIQTAQLYFYRSAIIGQLVANTDVYPNDNFVTYIRL